MIHARLLLMMLTWIACGSVNVLAFQASDETVRNRIVASIQTSSDIQPPNLYFLQLLSEGKSWGQANLLKRSDPDTIATFYSLTADARKKLGLNFVRKISDPVSLSKLAKEMESPQPAPSVPPPAPSVPPPAPSVPQPAPSVPQPAPSVPPPAPSVPPPAPSVPPPAAPKRSILAERYGPKFPTPAPSVPPPAPSVPPPVDPKRSILAERYGPKIPSPAPTVPPPAPSVPPPQVPLDTLTEEGAMARRIAIEAFYPLMIQAVNANNFSRARELCQKAMEWEPSVPSHFYNSACIEARAGNKELALQALSSAVTKGYHDLAHMQADHDLDSLRNEIRYKTIENYLQRIAKNPPKEDDSNNSLKADLPRAKPVEFLNGAKVPPPPPGRPSRKKESSKDSVQS